MRLAEVQHRPLEEHKIIVRRKCHYIIRIYLGHFQNNDKAILFPFQQINSEKIIASVIQFSLSATLNNAHAIQWPTEALQYHPHAQNCIHGTMWGLQRITVDFIKTEINALLCEKCSLDTASHI